MTRAICALPRTGSHRLAGRRRSSGTAPSAPARRGAVRDMLREMAFVLQLTRAVKESVLAEKDL